MLPVSSSTYTDSISFVLRKPLANTFQKGLIIVKVAKYLLKSLKPAKPKQQASRVNTHLRQPSQFKRKLHYSES